jgi:hypothetical protein
MVNFVEAGTDLMVFSHMTSFNLWDYLDFK